MTTRKSSVDTPPLIDYQNLDYRRIAIGLQSELAELERWVQEIEAGRRVRQQVMEIVFT